MSGPPTRPVPLVRAGVLLALAATTAAAQTEYPYAAGTDTTGRAQAVSDGAGRVLIESPEFPRGLWLDLADEAGQAVAGVQVEYQGRADSLVAFRCVDPSGLLQETLLWARPEGDPMSLALRTSEPADLPAGLAAIDWRIEPGAEEMLVQEEGQELTDWEAVAAFLQERWRGRTGRVAVQIDSNTALALDLAHAEPAARLVDYLQDQYRRSLGEVSGFLVGTPESLRTGRKPGSPRGLDCSHHVLRSGPGIGLGKVGIDETAQIQGSGYLVGSLCLDKTRSHMASDRGREPSGLSDQLGESGAVRKPDRRCESSGLPDPPEMAAPWQQRDRRVEPSGFLDPPGMADPEGEPDRRCEPPGLPDQP